MTSASATMPRQVLVDIGGVDDVADQIGAERGRSRRRPPSARRRPHSASTGRAPVRSAAGGSARARCRRRSASELDLTVRSESSEQPWLACRVAMPAAGCFKRNRARTGVVPCPSRGFFKRNQAGVQAVRGTGRNGLRRLRVAAPSDGVPRRARGATMVSRSSNSRRPVEQSRGCGRQSATIHAGSPGRRAPNFTAKSMPDTRLTASITSRTE